MEEKYGGQPLNTIQKRGKLNEVYCMDHEHPVNKGHHLYTIKTGTQGFDITFQNGPRHEQGSVEGVLDVDLLEIVRHRLQSFQAGPYTTRENAIALTHLEEALLWMNKRVEDRIEAGTLGTNKV
jgi:hypothetical protein